MNYSDFYLYKGKIRVKIAKIIGQEKYAEFKHRYAGRKILKTDEINQYIYNSLISGEPFMACRFGSTELSTLSSFYFNRTEEYQKAINHVHFYSGFFPNDVNLGSKFTDIMLEACRTTDFLAIWFFPYEDYYVKHILRKNAQIGYLMNMEPWKTTNPWTKALKGKKVLIIHPFEDSIKKQYKKRKLLFNNEDLLPEFELKTLKAVQTLAGDQL